MSDQRRHRKPRYRPDIDGLRAIAVALVVLFHAFPNFLGGGFVGVDVFFVISGYLITGNILPDIEAKQFSYLDFYARRCRRIVPALIVVLATVLAMGWFLLLPSEFLDLARQVIAGSTFTSNILLLLQTGYFDVDSNLKPLLHLWSLGVEEQYYLVWPAILVLAHKSRRSTAAIILLLGVLSFGFMLAVPQADAFYLLPSRFWELLIGGALAYCEVGNPELDFSARVATRLRLPPALLDTIKGGLAVLLLALSVIFLHDSYPGWNALLPTTAALLVIASDETAWLNRYILGNRVAVTVGLFSYPLYLWHWPLLSFARIVDGKTPPVGLRCLLVLISVGLAWATWRLIEIPVREKLLGSVPRALAPKAVIGATLAGLVILLLASDLIVQAGVVPSADLAFEDLGQTRWYLNLDRLFAGMARVGICDRGENCAVTPDRTPHFAVYGDSHAEHLFPGLVSALPESGWLLLSRSGCPPVAGIDVREKQDERNCIAWNKQAVDYLVKDKDVRTIVLSSMATAYFDNEAGTLYSRDGTFKVRAPSDQGGLTEVFYRGWSQTIGSLLDSGKRVVFAVDNPELAFDLDSCARRVMLPNLLAEVGVCSMSRAQYESRVASYRQIISRLRNELPRLLFYDPTNLFCDSVSCTPLHDGRFLYRDQDHLSVYGSAYVGADFRKWLEDQEIAE
jgi:peptidoglycan/LPS O-acetylase OafA/YrhL